MHNGRKPRKHNEINEGSYVTVDEIRAALSEQKISALGPDGIRCKDMHSLMDGKIADLTVFNNSIKNGTIEEDWLHSYLIPLPKTGKNHTRLQGYRIITMQITVRKLLEKIIVKKVLSHFEQFNLCPPGLCRYRPRREAWCNAGVLANDVFEGFHSQKEECEAAIDLETWRTPTIESL